MEFEKLTDEDLEKAWERACREFLDLPALRDLHFMRYLKEKWNFTFSEWRSLKHEIIKHIRERMTYWLQKAR